MDPGGSQVVSATNREFVEEFRMVANSFSAEFKGGKVFAVSTKSGGNDFHGGGNFLIMDDNLNATPWGATSVLPFRETEWGLQLGGPIVKNKTHFFVGFQRTRFDQNFPVFLTIPTPAQIGGDFSQTLNADGGLIQIYDPATTRPDPSDPTSLIRDPFPGNSIPSSRFDSVAVNMLGFYPRADPAGHGSRVVGTSTANGRRTRRSHNGTTGSTTNGTKNIRPMVFMLRPTRWNSSAASTVHPAFLTAALTL